YAFYNCTSLTSVVIGDSVTSIGSDAFEDCSSLTKVNYTGTIDEWVQIAFSDSYSNPLYYAKNLYINNELVTEANITTATKINNYAFYKYSSLTSVVIGDSVTSIGDYVFCYCDSLTSVVIGNSVTRIGSEFFSGCSSLTSILVDENNVSYKSIDGNLYSKDGKILIRYAPGKKDTVFTIPNSVTSIGEAAFSGCSSLTSVVIGDSVTSIGEEAFYDCDSLTSVVIGDSVTSIGKYAFFHCTSLTSVVIGDSVTSIGEDAFFNCSALTSVVIGDSVERIGNSAFSGCSSLTRIIFKDTSTWYRTDSNPNFINKTGGTQTSVADSSSNATYFNSTYCNYYWYKK
ncbi:MAG: leucine-rich repeat domain-containing protein, partial [Clostridia bacterium]|nr:leucine-rich repeat domain-containing protein [Clostridia bacterium]